MVCKKCGRELAEDCRVCPYCMLPTSEQGAPAGKNDSSEKTKKIIIIACAVIAVIALVAAAFIIGSHRNKPSAGEGVNSAALTASEPSGASAQSSDNTTAPPATTTTTTTTTTSKPEPVPTGGDWDNLADMFEEIEISNFNSKNATAQDVFELLYRHAYFALYEDLVSEIKDQYDDNYNHLNIIPVKGFNWLAKNVFNVEAKTVDSFTAYGEKAGYRKGDNYVITTYDHGYERPEFEVKSKTKNSDDSYNVVLTGYMEDFETGDLTDIGTVSATVRLKDADGKRFWSIYSIKSNLQ